MASNYQIKKKLLDLYLERDKQINSKKNPNSDARIEVQAQIDILVWVLLDKKGDIR